METMAKSAYRHAIPPKKPNWIGFSLDGYNYVNHEESADSMTILVEPAEEPERICPVCGSVSVVSDGKATRYYRDIEHSCKSTEIGVETQRLRCKDCGATFFPELPHIVEEKKDQGFRMTKRLYDIICDECFEDTFVGVAGMHGMDDRTVRDVFRQHCRRLDDEWVVTAPRVLGIDECHLANNARAVFVEMEKGRAARVIQMGEDNKKPTIVSVLKDMVIPPKHPDWPEVVTMDFTGHYKTAVEEVFGADTKIVIDHFHVQKRITKAMGKAFAASLKGLHAHMDALEAKGDKSVRKKWKAVSLNRRKIGVNREDLTPEQRANLKKAFEIWPQFAQIFEIKEEFRYIFNRCKSRKGAEEMYELWKDGIPKDPVFMDFRRAARLIDQWHTEVFNFFDCERFSNGPTEALNGVIKEINRRGKGYSYEMIRAKMLFRIQAPKKPRYVRQKVDAGGLVPPFSYINGILVPEGYFTAAPAEIEVIESGCGVDVGKILEYEENLRLERIAERMNRIPSD